MGKSDKTGEPEALTRFVQPGTWEIAAMLKSPAIAISVLLAVTGAAQAQQKASPAIGYPERAVRVLVGAPPGSGSDVLMRLTAQKLLVSSPSRLNTNLNPSLNFFHGLFSTSLIVIGFVHWKVTRTLG